jgi:mannosyltransferase OCH1-like enzyme
MPQLWTEKASRDFIETEYPWFLNAYDGYRYPVQRVDAVRYFLMLHYGGIYMDLDNVGGSIGRAVLSCATF